MDLFGIGAIANAATNATIGTGQLGLGVFNAINQSNISKKNLQFQKDVFNYQQQLQREIFQREDNAIQRRAADISAAGGNPAMAWETGTGAQAGTPVGVTAPQEQAVDYSQIMNSSLSQISGAFQQFMDMQLKDEQIRSLRAGVNKTNAEVVTENIKQLNLMAEESKNYADAAYYRSLAKKEAYNLEYSVDKNIRTTDNNTTMYNSIKDFVNTIIPENIEVSNLSMRDVAQIALDVGLFALPGMAGMKAAKLGIKGLKKALQYFRHKNGFIGTVDEFKVLFYKLSGRMPSKNEVEKFRLGITQKVSKNPYDKYK